jgi:putative peptidoglycan lipid II flippase
LPQILKTQGETVPFFLWMERSKSAECHPVDDTASNRCFSRSINFLVINYIASYMASGSIQLILGAGFNADAAGGDCSISCDGFFCRCSVQAARGDFSEMRSALASTLRLVLFIAIPASVGLIIFEKSHCAFDFERRAFTSQNDTNGSVGINLVWRRSGWTLYREVVSRAFMQCRTQKTGHNPFLCDGFEYGDEYRTWHLFFNHSAGSNMAV